MSKSPLKLNTTLKMMKRLYSHKYGLINTARESEPAITEVSINNERYALGNMIPMYITSVQKGESNIFHGSGASLNQDRSKIKAYGEFIERFCGAYSVGEQLPNLLVETQENLELNNMPFYGFDGLLPFENFQYDIPTFPYHKYSPKHKMTWIEGEDVTCGKKTWLPTQKVLIAYPYHDDELHYIDGISTGLACGETFKHASVSALLEVIERDSFMLTWVLKMPGIRIVMDDFRNAGLKALYNHFLKHLVGEDRLYIYDISRTGGVYTIMTFIRNNLCEAFGLIVATASHTDPEIALLKSLEELCLTQSFSYNALIKDKERICQNMKPEEVYDLEKHLLYYSTGRHSHNIDFISASEKSVNLSALPDYATTSVVGDFEYLIDLFRQQGCPAFFIDVTKPEIRKIGFSVVKSIVPGYVDLEVTHNARHLKSERFNRYRNEGFLEINDNPHPFP